MNPKGPNRAVGVKVERRGHLVVLAVTLTLHNVHILAQCIVLASYEKG